MTCVNLSFSAPVLQKPKATSSTLYFDSLTVNAVNGGCLHGIQMDKYVNAANQVVSVGDDIAFDAEPNFLACLVRFESSSVPNNKPTAYDVYCLDGSHDVFFFQAEDGIRDHCVTGVQTCALPISPICAISPAMSLPGMCGSGNDTPGMPRRTHRSR